MFLYKLININTDADKLIMNEHSYKIENEQHGLLHTTTETTTFSCKCKNELYEHANTSAKWTAMHPHINMALAFYEQIWAKMLIQKLEINIKGWLYS